VTSPIERLREALAGRYAIERELGAGGMATVYLAQDLKHDRKVAVKVLRPELAAALDPDRFPREIRILARLQHPHILVKRRPAGGGAGQLLQVPPGMSVTAGEFALADKAAIAIVAPSGLVLQRIAVPPPTKSP
jgi:hypothetical protein